MEAQLLFILPGIIVFIICRLMNKKPYTHQLLFVTIATLFVSGLLYFFKVAVIRGVFSLPLWIVLLSGVMAGLMLTVAHRARFFTESGMRYSATILLSVVHAALMSALILLMQKVTETEWLYNPALAAYALPLLLISFMQFFGFALLERLPFFNSAENEKT